MWIDVPNDGTGPIYPANATDAQIEAALRAYVSDVIPTGTSSDNNRTTTKGYTDTWHDGCGLGESEYNAKKSTMLNSIKDNGGFYIGKYETGYFGNTIRTSGGNTTQTAVIKQNAYPYNYVTCSEAEDLAEGFATDGKTSSLLFGIQWDLVLKFIKVKENLSDNTILTSNSTTWGNYYNKTYNITNTDAWYSIDYGTNWTKGTYSKSSNGDILLTTGAHTDFSKQKIYDLAGNVWEWTLEKSSISGLPCAYRGGYHGEDGDYCPASYRSGSHTSGSSSYHGFRVALY